MSYQPRKSVITKFHLIPQEETMKTVTYTIPNISCMHCVHTIKTEIGEVAGVKSVDANAQTKVTVITFDAPATEDKIVEVLKEINYPPQAN